MKTYHVTGGEDKPLVGIVETQNLWTDDEEHAKLMFDEIVETEDWVQMTVYSDSVVKSSVYSCR